MSDKRTLARRPLAEARSVDALVQDVLQGKIRIPGWQRPIKWEVEDAQKLLDSLYRGYPIGTLLFWKREGPSEKINFGSVQVNAAARSDALYVVDGQQRITTLVRVLAGDGSDPFALYFDLDNRKVVQPRRDGPDPRWLPLTEILDSRRLVKWILAHPEADQETQDTAIDLGARIREYAVPAYIVESDSDQAVRDVFERTNDTGKRLDANEVFDGRFRGLDTTEPAGLRDVADALVDIGFGRLDNEQLHAMMLATRFTDLTKGDTTSWSPVEAHAALVDLQAAARRVLSFLLDDASIPHLHYLPYAQPLLTLARFFHFHPNPHPRNRVLLARWVWRGASAGLHGGASVGTRATLKAIDESDEDFSVQRLLQLVSEGASMSFDPSASHFWGHHAKAKIGVLALAELGPRHLVTGAPIDLGAVQPLQVIDRGERKSSLGNRVLHPQVRGGLRRAILACDSSEILASHEIELPGRTLLQGGGADLFIGQREKRLVERVKTLVRRHTLWGDSDRPPLRALLDDEGDD
jgi:hypothetical protein